MKIAFACPSCGAPGSADEAFVGRTVRCKHCGHRFPIPGTDSSADDDGYGLDAAEAPRPPPSTAPPVYVSSRGDEPAVFVPRRKAAASKKKTIRRVGSGVEWRTWLIRGGITLILALVTVGMFAPQGPLIVAIVLALLGSVMVFASWAVGAYGAFSEDSLVGWMYVLLPFYSAYYFITRRDDLWRWWICSAVGAGFTYLAREIASRSIAVD